MIEPLEDDKFLILFTLLLVMETFKVSCQIVPIIMWLQMSWHIARES